MALQKTLKGNGNADIDYHMIPHGSLSKNLENNTYSVSFDLLGFVDEAARTVNASHLKLTSYTKSITEAQMGHIIGYLGLYDHIKANDSNYTDAVDVL